jgi:hypothetical protein
MHDAGFRVKPTNAHQQVRKRTKLYEAKAATGHSIHECAKCLRSLQVNQAASPTYKVQGSRTTDTTHNSDSQNVQSTSAGGSFVSESAAETSHVSRHSSDGDNDLHRDTFGSEKKSLLEQRSPQTADISLERTHASKSNEEDADTGHSEQQLLPYSRAGKMSH